MHAQWDTGFLIGMWIFMPVVIIGLLIAIISTVVAILSKGDHGVGAFMGGLVCVVIGVLAIVAIWFPFGSQYNRFVPKSGTVAKVGYRFLSDGSGGTDQKYVITFKDGRSFGVLDTRAANITPGDKATVLCERSFQFNAPSEGWDCNWGRDVKPDGSVIP